jgi:thymidylate synthase (FAD)
MPEFARPQVKLVGYTKFVDDNAPFEWSKVENSPYTDAGSIIEYGGRACYMSFSNPLHRTNAEYIENIIQQGHFSVLEHASATFFIRGVSRSLTHELVRHRYLSPSQLSQRYVDESQCRFVMPPQLEELFENGDDALKAQLEKYLEDSMRVYTWLTSAIASSPGLSEISNRTERRKRAREAARCVLPNMTETMAQVSGNLRAWCACLKKRGSPHAEREIRRLACMILDEFVMNNVCPPLFNHFVKGDDDTLTTDIDWE